MSYSLTKPQVVVLTRIEEFCRHSTGVSNQWKDANARYSFEKETVAKDGDNILGTVWKQMNPTTSEPTPLAYPEGKFYIEADGTVIFFHFLPKEAYSDSV